MPRRLTEVLTPPRFLLLTYAAGAAIGLVQGLVVARLLGPAGYGVVGILVTLGGLAANFWDVRLIDLATKLHYAKAGNAQEQTASMRMLLLLNGALGILMAGTTCALIWLGWRFFTGTPPEAVWVAIQGLTIGIAFLTGTVQSLQRLANSFYTFALGRLAAQLASFLIMTAWLYQVPSISGYYDSLLAANVFSLFLAFLVLSHVWRGAFGHGVTGPEIRSAWQAYRSEGRFIFSANIFSYSKMLSRSGDILIFGAFASDSATGIYRLARSLADNLNIFVDAIMQYYNPRLMQLQAEGNRAEFRHLANRFVLGGAMASALIVPVAWIGLELVNTFILLDRFHGLGLTTALLAANFFWIAGVHPWLWPALIHAGQTSRMARLSMTGALVQAALIAGLSYALTPRPELAALGAVAYYLICYPSLLAWWKKQ